MAEEGEKDGGGYREAWDAPVALACMWWSLLKSLGFKIEHQFGDGSREQEKWGEGIQFDSISITKYGAGFT